MSTGSYPQEGARRFGIINWLGVWTLYLKEVRRFWKVMTQTVAAPVITTLLYLAIFALAIGKFRPDVHGVPFIEFLAARPRHDDDDPEFLREYLLTRS